MVVFLTRNICRKLRISVISPSQWNMSLVSIIWVIWRKEMSTCEGPDFWGLHKNMNCAFLLKVQSCKWYNNKYKWRIHACFTFVKSYKMQLKVFLFLFVLHQFLYQRTDHLLQHFGPSLNIYWYLLISIFIDLTWKRVWATNGIRIWFGS